MREFTTQEVEEITAEKRLREITKDINERMAIYTHSAQPTEDEVSVCWLLCEVERLNKLLIITA